MPNWPAPDLEVQYFLCMLPNQYSAFGPIKIDRITKAGCIFCMPENLISGTAAKKFGTFMGIIKLIQLHHQYQLQDLAITMSTTDGWTNIYQDHLVNYIAIGKNRKSELIKVKDTHRESQTSTTIFRDLVEVIIELGIEKISAIISDRVANYVQMKTLLVQQFPKILTIRYIALESNLLDDNMLKHTYIKSTITSTLKIITYLRKSKQALQFI
ncbi:7918_t:CDS:2 [Gigaspora margarita]|uniref:7918_t:CDS:1 n=1 Tax=Gigaspora margarita TaxID=4874 RepID=A0ABN7V4I4_GIGMA|nr:7918_t:CDS:2 [Gigaspora margarita]